MAKSDRAGLVAIAFMLVEIILFFMLGVEMMFKIHAGLFVLFCMFLPAYSLFGGRILDD
jgi:hypothetical protein